MYFLERLVNFFLGRRKPQPSDIETGDHTNKVKFFLGDDQFTE